MTQSFHDTTKIIFDSVLRRPAARNLAQCVHFQRTTGEEGQSKRSRHWRQEFDFLTSLHRVPPELKEKKENWKKEKENDVTDNLPDSATAAKMDNEGTGSGVVLHTNQGLGGSAEQKQARRDPAVPAEDPWVRPSTP